MSRTIGVNMNAAVHARLTVHGARVWNAYWIDFHNNELEKVKPHMRAACDPVDAPLWDVMQVFGPKLSNGARAMFVDNVFNLLEGEMVTIWPAPPAVKEDDHGS